MRRRESAFKVVVAGCLVSLVAIGIGTGGCASVKIRKIPTPTQYIRWTDAMQHKADKMEGLRFYLPRPFVTVFESFPIRTDIYIANGLVSPDGKYVIIREVTSESGLSRYIANDPRLVSIPRTYIFDRSAFESEGGLAGAPLELADATKMIEALGGIKDLKAQDVLTGVTGARKPTPTPTPAASQRPPQAATGMGRRASTNDNGAFAYQPLRGNFDLVYLPDFEEQYIVTEKSMLGNAMFEINLGQGWSLQGFNSLTDNSELNRRIFDLIDASIDIAKAAASGALGIPGLPSLPPGLPSNGLFIPEGDGKTDLQTERIPGTPVTLKIVVVHYAAKGLYPVIKPRELQERTIDPGDSFGVLDLFKIFPKVQMSSNLDPTAIARAQRAIDNQTGSYTVPRYPYQYLSFNAFRYMAIEVVRPTDDDTSPFQHLYDKTGTQGDVGDARQGEITELLDWLVRVFGRKKESDDKKTGQDKQPSTKPVDLFLDLLSTDKGPQLPKNAKSTDPHWVIAPDPRPTLVDGVLTVTLLSKKGATDDPNTNEYRKSLLKQVHTIIETAFPDIEGITRVEIKKGAADVANESDDPNDTENTNENENDNGSENENENDNDNG